MSYGNYPDFSQIKKILVVHFRHLGDVLLATPIYEELKKHHNDVSIDALIYEEGRALLEGNPHISYVHGYDRKWKKNSFFKKLWREWRLLRKIRRKKYDLVINLTEGDRGAIVALFSGAKYKVGLDPQNSGFYKKKQIFSHLVKDCSTSRHQVERYCDVLRKIGVFPEDKKLFVPINAESQKKVSLLLQEHGLEKKNYILIHPVSRWLFKCANIDQWRQLISSLSKRGKKIVVSGGNNRKEKEIVQKIVQDLPAIDLAGQISLKELCSLVAMSQCVFSVDTVVPHIASALKVPLVVLFGPTSEIKWGPWQHEKSAVVTKDFLCRPCLLDGCGGSKYSECLDKITEREMLRAYDSLKLSS